MNRLVYTIPVLAAVFISQACKDRSAEPHWVDYLGGIIEDWQPGAYNTAYFTVATGDAGRITLDSAKVGEHGEFGTVLSFLTPPDEAYQQSVPLQDTPRYCAIRDTRALSNPAARYALLTVSVRDQQSGHLKDLYSGNVLVDADSLVVIGDFQVRLFYFSRPTALTGQYTLTCFDSAPTGQLHDAAFMTDYAVDAAAGWNRIVTTVVADDGYTRRYQVTSRCIGAVRWFARSFGSIAFPGAGGLP
jgi:hypothetical protein